MWAEAPAPEVLEAPSCNAAAQPCVMTHSDVEVTLELGPKMRSLVAFPVLVQVTGMSLQRVDVRFDMQGMSMGMNRFQLQETGSGQWSGESMLPVCWTGRRDWFATVELHGKSQNFDVVFQFVTE